MTPFDPYLPRKALSLLGIALLGLALPACNHRKADVTSSIITDVRERHPIVLSEAPRSIEIFGSSGRIDQRQSNDLAAFAAEYRQHGRSQMIAEVPTYDGRSVAGSASLRGVRDVLARNGVASSLVQVRSYPGPDHTVAAPIRLSFAKLQARVPHACGQWPDDLGASSWRLGATNTSYWNFGCAYQQNLAATVADPIDLERGMPEGRIDTVRRMNAIAKLREGQDPSTTYRDAATQINQAVGN